MENTAANQNTIHRKHMGLESRYTIMYGLDNREPFRLIASKIGMSPSTVRREVTGHYQIVHSGYIGHCYNACLNRRDCTQTGLCPECIHTNPKKHRCCFCNKGCNYKCPDFVPEYCPDLKNPPYVCNGCIKRSRCSLEKHIYKAMEADRESKQILSESRTGISLSEEEIKTLDELITPLVLKGQSLYHISIVHKNEINCSLSTLYNYIDQKLLSVNNIDLPRKVRYKQRKKGKNHKVDKCCTEGRTYEDYLEYLKLHPGLPVVEMDSVEGKPGGKVLLTLYFTSTNLQLSFIRDRNNAQSVIDIFNDIYLKIGAARFQKLFPIILTDNGSEFSNPKEIEFDKDNIRRTRIFYCHPSSPEEKGACERNHEDIRRIIPKGTSLDPYTQEDISLMMNHINSYMRPGFNGKCTYELFAFLYGEDVLHLLGCTLIPPDEVTLIPKLLLDRVRSRNLPPNQ